MWAVLSSPNQESIPVNFNVITSQNLEENERLNMGFWSLLEMFSDNVQMYIAQQLCMDFVCVLVFTKTNPLTTTNYFNITKLLGAHFTKVCKIVIATPL